MYNCACNWLRSALSPSVKNTKKPEKKLNPKIVTALAAAREISVGAAAVTAAVSELDREFTLREEKKGTKAFLDGKGVIV